MALRLRQICLVAPQLEPAIDAVRDIFGVDVCHRDGNVGKYGLVNALFVFGHQFLEFVAPTRGDTAAGRFLERSGGRGGYMAIFDCDDPERRRDHAEGLGVRVAHTLSYPGKFWGIQLHPRDCRATMLEFDRSEGDRSLGGAHWPAGEHWQQFRNLGRVSGIPWIDIASPTPADLAAHWSRIAETAVVADEHGRPALRFDLGAARFIEATGHERLDVLHVDVDDADRVRAAAKARGLPSEGDGFVFCGVRFEPRTLP